MTVTDPVTAWLMVPDAPDLNEWFASLTRRPTWHAEAACRGAGTSAFFPTRGVNAATMTRARAVCAGCPVRAECLTHALDNPDAVGVWGATTDRERRPIRASMA